LFSGTEVFKQRAVPISERPVLKALIGTEAEDLIWAFGIMNRESFEEQVRSLHRSEELEKSGGEQLLPPPQDAVYTVACSDIQRKRDPTMPCDLVLDITQMHTLALMLTANTVEQAPRMLTKGRLAVAKWVNRLQQAKENFGASLPLSAVAHIDGLVAAHPMDKAHQKKAKKIRKK
jgi:hypothetical protein